MKQLQRTTQQDIIDHKHTFLDALLAAKAEGNDIDDVIRILRISINRGLQREKQERTA